MKELIINDEVIDINDIESMRVSVNKNPNHFDCVQINFKNGDTTNVFPIDPEKYIEDYFTKKNSFSQPK
jgi:hypothetical protein